jgi:Tol biopolymer transport system component
VAWLVDGPAGNQLVLNGQADPFLGAIKSAPVISPDGKRMAYKVDADGGARRALVVDGKVGPAYESVNNGSIRFSADSASLSCSASDANGNSIFIRNGKVVAEGPDIKSDPVLTPDFKRVAYKVAVGDQRAVMLDGQRGPVFAQVDNATIEFSPNGQHLAYVAADGPQDNAKESVVLDQISGPVYDRVAGLTFSADGNHLAYVAEQAGKEHVVLDGKQGPAYDAIDPYFLRFLPDDRLGYRASVGNQMFLVVAGAIVGQAEGILDWAAAGKSIAFVGRTGESWWVEANEKRSPSYSRVVAPLAFSPDGRRLVYEAEIGGRWLVVADGHPGPAWDRIAQPPVFSANGSHWGYAASRAGKWYIIVDGKSNSPYDWFQWGSPEFSPDGGHYAFAARANGRWTVALDGKPVVSGDEPGPLALRFSPNGRHFACPIEDGGQWRMIVDGTTGPPVDRLFSPVPQFLPDGSLEYLAIQGKTLVRVTHH